MEARERVHFQPGRGAGGDGAAGAARVPRSAQLRRVPKAAQQRCHGGRQGALPAAACVERRVLNFLKTHTPACNPS